MVISIQYLRAVAALLVVFFHAVITPKFASQAPNASDAFGAVGVDIFFVISGFVMSYTMIRAPLAPSEFILKRIIRIAPAYWIVTILMFVMPLVSKTIAAGITMDVSHLVASLFFVPWFNPLDPSQNNPIYRPGWTLNYEMFFYALFGFGLMVRPVGRALAMISCCLTALVCVGWILQYFHRQTLFLFYASFYTSPLLLEFGLGMLVGWLCVYGKKLSPWVAGCIMAFGFSILLLRPYESGVEGLRALFWGLPSGCIVYGAVSIERSLTIPRIGLFRLLGDASYSIYLTHLFSIGGIFVFFNRIGVKLQSANVGLILFVLVSFLVSMFVGVLFHIGIERPLTGALADYSRRRRVVRSELASTKATS